MSIDGFEPLNEEERVLAAKLGMGRRNEAPSPAVDQAIRHMAQSALARPHTHKAAGSAWWKAGGVAAVCVLAVGLAWKTLHAPSTDTLATAPPVPPAMDKAALPAPADPSTAEIPAAPADEAQAAPVATPVHMESKDVQAPDAAPATPADAAKRAPAEVPMPMRTSGAQARTAATPAETADTAAMAETDGAVALPKLRVAASPPPPPEEVNAAQRANTAALEAPQPVPTAAQAPHPASQAAPVPVTVKPAPIERAEAGTLENGYDPRPPKTTEAEDVQLAWLKRIRTLYQSGKKAEAAASLEAWRKRYPDAPVPVDLAPLGKVTPEK